MKELLGGLLFVYFLLLSIATFCEAINIDVDRTLGKEICSKPKPKLMFHKFLPSRQVACFLMKEVD